MKKLILSTLVGILTLPAGIVAQTTNFPNQAYSVESQTSNQDNRYGSRYYTDNKERAAEFLNKVISIKVVYAEKQPSQIVMKDFKTEGFTPFTVYTVYGSILAFVPTDKSDSFASKYEVSHGPSNTKFLPKFLDATLKDNYLVIKDF